MTALGGDRVIYCADNNHGLEYFLVIPEPLDHVESLLAEKLGEPANSPEEAFHSGGYFIDRFADI